MRSYGIALVSSILSTAMLFSLTVTQANASWQETTLYAFNSNTPDGEEPIAGVIRGPHGELYGATTKYQESDTLGIGFELIPPATPGGSWTEKIIHVFPDPTVPNDGENPFGPLLLGSRGQLYGMTARGDSATVPSSS